MAETANTSGGRAAPPVRGLALTFRTLARSQAPGAPGLLFAALEDPDAGVQLAASQAVLRYARKEGAPRLIAAFHRLAPEAADDLVARVDDLIYALRETLSNGPAESRVNAVEILRRAGRVKYAYLLVQALTDRDGTAASRALEALRRMTDEYHSQVESARDGLGAVTRAELEARRFALLDPILALLANRSLGAPDELLQLAMALDVRANEFLFGLLASRDDARVEPLRRILWNSSRPQVVSFLFDALRDSRVSPSAVEVLRSRRDFPFVKAVLSSHRFFTDYRVRDSLRRVDSAEFLLDKGEAGPGAPAGTPRKDVFSSAPLALRAIHFVVLSGLAGEEKLALLRSVALAQAGGFVGGIAENVLKALSAGQPAAEVSAALVYLEGEMGLRSAASRPAAAGAKTPSAVELPEMDLPWATPETRALPDDAFTQFFNAFDSLDEATKMLAAQTLRRLDPAHLEQLRQELASLEPERRLKAVKIVLSLHRERRLEEPLLGLSGDPDRHVRATVVKALGLMEDEPAIRCLLEAVTDSDRRVVANSVEAIEALGREELLDLVRIFAAHPNNRIRANAVKALWTMGDRQARRQLDEMLADPDEMMRLSATWLLGEIDHPLRIETLTRLSTSDPSERVRVKALSILGEGT